LFFRHHAANRSSTTISFGWLVFLCPYPDTLVA
jgi:hypothetical protein